MTTPNEDTIRAAIERLKRDQTLEAETLIIRCFEVGFFPLDCANFVLFTELILRNWVKNPACEALQLRAVLYARELQGFTKPANNINQLKTVVDAIANIDSPSYYFPYSPRKNFSLWLAVACHGYYGQLRQKARERNRQRQLNSQNVA